MKQQRITPRYELSGGNTPHMYNFKINDMKYEVASKRVKGTFVRLEWLDDYNEANDTHRARLLFAQASESDNQSKGNIIMSRLVSNGIISVIANLDSDEFGNTDDEKEAFVVENLKGEKVDLTVVTVSFDEPLYTDDGIMVRKRSAAYVGCEDLDAYTAEAIVRRVEKDIENGILSERDPNVKLQKHVVR